MERPETTLPLLRLLQITDSAFPVGGYAYSHGLEWLVAEGRVSNEDGLADLLSTLVSQTVRRQWLPAAARAFMARSQTQLRRIDAMLDASISAAAERAAGRAMGQRLMEVCADIIGVTEGSPLAGLRESPKQFAAVFGALGQTFALAELEMLSALGYSLVSSVTQAAVRLGVIGAQASARLVANSLQPLAEAATIVEATRRPAIGSFAPGVELAAMLQPTLRFRMFAS